MYVPSFDSLLKAIGLTRADFEDSAEITVPTSLFKLILQIALAGSDFNETGYLRANTDIATAVRTRSLRDPRLHYIGYGFFEGRDGATPEVDEDWYLSTYPDVAEAVRTGHIASAAEHFKVVGASEGRSPSAEHSVAAEQWKKAIKALPL